MSLHDTLFSGNLFTNLLFDCIMNIIKIIFSFLSALFHRLGRNLFVSLIFFMKIKMVVSCLINERLSFYEIGICFALHTSFFLDTIIKLLAVWRICMKLWPPSPSVFLIPRFTKKNLLFRFFLEFFRNLPGR